MATYVNNLRLTEITTGDESGTWGTTTNSNWDFATDAFGYGVKNMAADADQTFTMADGTVDTLRSMYLKITSTGSLTATRTITIAPTSVSKVWIIENATSGSQSIIIKQGSGATVTIATGAKTMVYSDGAGAGAAVISANFTAATSGTVTSVAATVPSLLSISGSPITTSGTLAFTYSGTALPVANGGTGITSLGAGVATFLGTPSSANLLAAVTDETGTGSLVFATSPTLVTPVLGTPTSGTLSACTVDGTNSVGFKSVPAVGTKTASYTLAVGDVGKYVQLGASGAIVIPDATFAEGNAITLFNNTASTATITCSITTAYIAGTFTDKATMTLAAAGVATILFISGTTCVVAGNVT